MTKFWKYKDRNEDLRKKVEDKRAAKFLLEEMRKKRGNT